MAVVNNLEQPFSVRARIIDSGIKATRLAQIISFKCHARSGTVAAWQVGIKRMLAAVLFQVENDACKALAKAAILLKEILRLRLKFHWQHVPCYAYDIGRDLKAAHQFDQPVLIDEHIIIGVREKLCTRCTHTSIACPRNTGALFAYVAHTSIISIVL